MSSGGQTNEYVETGPDVLIRPGGTRPAMGDLVFHRDSDSTIEFFAFTNVPFLVIGRVPCSR